MLNGALPPKGAVKLGKLEWSKWTQPLMAMSYDRHWNCWRLTLRFAAF